MSAIGSYETVEDIPSRPWVRVATVRRSGEDGPARLVLKAAKSLVGLDSPADAERRRRELLASAAVQRQAAEARGSQHWVGVVDSSSSVSETFVVMERFDRSAGDLARQRRLTRGELRSVVLAVLDGLAELGAACGRGHGRVHAGNVLLRSRGRSAVGVVALCDPAPQAPGLEGVDARDLGHLIRHLGAGFEDRAGEPRDSAWGHLGGGASFWRDLAGELIGAGDGGGAPDLAAVRGRVAREAPGDPTSKAPWIVGVAAVVLAALGVGGWLFFGRTETVSDEELAAWWPEVCVQVDGWCRDLKDRLADAERPFAAGSAGYDFVEARTKEIVSGWEGLEGALKDRSGGRSYWFGLTYQNRDAVLDAGGVAARLWDTDSNDAKARKRVGDARSAVRRVEALLDGGGEDGPGWTTQTELARLGAVCRDRGWTGVAALVEEARASVHPSAYWAGPGEPGPVWGGDGRYEPDAATRLAGAIVSAAALEYRLDELERAVTEAEGARDELVSKAQGDGVVGAIGGLLERETGPLGSATDQGVVGAVLERVTAINGALAEARAFVGSPRWARVNTRAFREETGGLERDGSLSVEALREWVRIGERCVVPEEQNPVEKMLDDLSQARKDLESYVGPGGQANPEADAVRQSIGGLEQVLEGEKGVWIEEHRAEIEAAARGHADEFRALRERVDAFRITREDLLAELRQDTDAPRLPAVLAEYWGARRAAWLSGVEAGQMEPYPVHHSREQLAASLTAISDRLPALELTGVPAAFDGDRIARAVDAERGAALGRALDAVDKGWALGDYALDDADERALADEASSREAWLRSAAQMVKELGDAYAALEAYEPLGEGGSGPGAVVAGWGSKPVYDDLGGGASFGPLNVLVGDLRSVAGADRAGLIAWVERREERPQAAYAAWRRLGEAGLLWPATASELDAARGYVGAALSALGADAGLSGVVSVLRAEASRRWGEAALAMMRGARWDDLESAFDPAMMDAFGVSDLGGFSEEIRLNHALYALKVAARGDDEAAAAGIATYRDAVSGLAIAAAREDGAALADLEARAEGGTDEAKLVGAGPGGVGWAGELLTLRPGGEPGEGLRFTLGGMELRFELLGDGSVSPLVYVCTSETSIDVASWALARAGGVSAVSGDWPALTDGKWSGVRLWRVQGDSLVADQDPQGRPDPGQWFDWTPEAGRVEEKFARGLRLYGGSSPAGEYPLQQVSYAGAERLASAVGCRLPTAAEWGRAAEVGDGGTPNLRDTSFAAQRDYVAKANSQLPFPDQGIFGAGDLKRGLEAGDGTGTDGVLFFDPVGGSGGFEHLLGNVAEFVELAGRPAVVGGSALAPTSGGVAGLREATAIPGARAMLVRRQLYADVGFRLALTIDGTLKPSLARLVREWFGEGARYVPPGG